MKKSISFAFYFLLCMVKLSAQTTQGNTGASGGEATGSGGNASFTAGEVFYTFKTGATGSSTDGMQQTYSPTIISFTPASGAPGTLFTITGTNLSSLTAFKIGGVTASAIVVSNTGTSLVGMVMPGAATGTVAVTTSGGTATSAGTFTVQNTSYPIIQQGTKLTASNDLLTPGKGWSVALSADGTTALVGGYYDNNGVGASWVYTRSGNTWSQQTKLIGTGAAVNAWQGFSVALSADGNTAIVGGVIDNSAWVFTRSGTTWAQQGPKLVGSDRVGNAWFGKSVSLSADGNTAIVGGWQDNTNAGAAWIFTRSGSTWAQQGTKLVGTGAVGAAGQGTAVSLSADGNIAAIGGAYDDTNKGATWIFTRSGNTWVHQKIVVPGLGAVKQGQSVALSADATTLMIGGVNATSNVSNAWVFTRSGSNWTQQGTTLAGSDAVGTAANGTSVTLTADGTTAMMGSVSDNNNTGAAWVFTRSGSTWTQQGNKLLGTGATGTTLYEGRSVALSANGTNALVGADGDATNLGAVWSYSTGVTYHGNGNTGGTVPSSALATIGSSITLATNTGTLVKTGYTFAGWNTLADGTGTFYAEGASVTFNGSLPLYAKWTLNNYMVTFNANGGSGTMSNQSIAYLASANLTTNTFTRTGYSFAGWATTSAGAVAYANSASFTMSSAANVTLYALWTLNNYTITFNAHGGDGGFMPSQSIAYLASANLTTNAYTRVGFTFDGWASYSGGNLAYTNGASFTMSAAANVTLYALWKLYTITFDANGGTGTMPNQPFAIFGYSYLTNNAFNRTGYTFAGWATTIGGNVAYANGARFMMSEEANVTLYAKWTLNNYTVTFDANGGTGTMTNQSIAYLGSANLTPNSYTRTGYTFAGWATTIGGSVAYASGDSYTMNTAANVTLYAKWTANNYTVTFDANGGTGLMSNQTIAYNASANLTSNAFTRTGYTFAGWATTSGGAVVYASGDSYTMNTAANVILYAKWTINNYTVTFDANGGIGTMSNQSIAYLASANLTTNAFTRTGYTFAGWATISGGTVSYANGASYTMSIAANVTLYAKWNCITTLSTTNVSISYCSLPYNWNGINRTSSGTYNYITTNSVGCDSIATLILTVSTPVTPTFTAIAAICSVDSLSALPTTSNNNITGSWTPPLNNLETTTYTFTPNLGVCATIASLTIAVNPVPTNIVATGINNGGYISFTAPLGTGITNYQYSLDNGANWISPSPAVTRSPLVISNGLNNCTTYQVRLRAVTPTCFGPASAQATFTPTNSILPGVNWTSFDQSYLSNNSYSVTHGNGLFVAVGTNNASYSTDGITWTLATTPAGFSSWRSVTYGNGIFVAVSSFGTGNRVMTSPDGVTWTSRTPSANNNWRSITYGNGLFVAVSNSGTGNRVMTSPDGVTWTSRTSAADNNWASITYGNDIFVAVSTTGTGNRVMTSSDGITWTSRTTQIAKSWRSVTYGNGLFVAISPYDNLTTGNDVMTSTDGISWTHTSSSFDADWHSIAYGNGLFVAIRGYIYGPNDDVTSISISSSDGINWTPTYQDFSGSTSCLTYGNGSFVSVGDDNISFISTYQVAANAPSIDSLTTSGTSAVVAFTTSLPTNLESTAITNFEYSLDNGSTWITPSPTVTTSPLIIENLANGNYQLRIRAVNSIGKSCPSAMTAFTICSNVGATSGTPTVCSNSALTNIIHITTGITGIGIATGLPAGVTASWANDTIKITGTPTDSGTFNYNIPLAGGCGAISATGTITVKALPEISITGNTTICAGAVSTLTVQSNNIAPIQLIPLDEVAGARLAVGLRKLRTAYNGFALRLRRSLDNQEQDFGFAGNDLDVNAISTWLNGDSAYCIKLYDQSGNGGDVSQTSVAAQPLLVISGINNNPSLRFTTAQSMFNAVNYPAPFSVIYGSKVIGGTSARVLAAKNNNWLLGYWGGEQDRAYFEGWVNEGNTPTVANKYNIYAATGTGSISTVYKNGTQIASNGNGLTGPNGIQLNGYGEGGNTTETSNCEFTDVMIYNSALSASEIAQLSNNISSYQNYTIKYLWSTGETSPSIAVNTVGTYSVMFTNTNGCSASSSITVKNPLSNTNVSICSSATPYVWNGGSYTSSGVYTHTANSTLGCDSIATLNLTINSCTTTLNITTFLEGFYTGNGTMRANLYDLGISTNDTETDSVDVNLWSVANLSSSTPDFTVRSVLHTNGTLTAVFPGATLNNSYYVALKHRNSVELWSAAPVTIASTTNHDFSSSLNAAFSDGFSQPLKWMNGNKYAMFGGDVNQDGTVDLFDAQITENGASNFLFGYDSSDCNGDGSTDLFDLQLIDNNSTLFLFYARPF